MLKFCFQFNVFTQGVVCLHNVDFCRAIFPLNISIVAKFIQDPVERLLEATFLCSYL